MKKSPYKLGYDYFGIEGPGVNISLELEDEQDMQQIVKELNFLANTITAYQKLVSAYRTNGPTPERSLDVIAAFHKRINLNLDDEDVYSGD
jgi:hypothetical protein